MRTNRWLALTVWLLAAAAAHAGREDYVLVIQGQRAGAMQVDRDGGTDGEQVRVDWSWRDNGRGPDMREEFRVGAGQQAVHYRVRGKSTFDGEIREDFTIADGRLRWTSVADRGDEAALPGQVFVPLESTPAYWGQMLRALLAQPSARAPTIGGSVLAAERLARVEVDGPGGRVPVALYAVTGAELEPWFLWLRDDGERRFFAVLWSGWYLTPAGYEAAAQALFERQRQARNEQLAALRQRTALPLPGLTLVRGARWFDAPAGALREPADVYLFDGRIAAITAPGAWQAAPQQTVDAQGLTLLPGLIDMHAHLWSADAGLMHLAGGVTTVRDLANQNADLERLKQRIDRGELAGPRIVAAGFIEGRSPFSSRNGIVVDDLDAGLRAVDWYAARGYRQIKLYNSIRPEWVAALAARAHQHGMSVAGHVPAFMRAEEAVRAGYDELTHINQMMLNFFVKPDQDTRTTLRFHLVAEEARHVAAEGAAARSFIALLRERGTTVDPTLAAFEAQFSQRDGQPNPSLAAVADHLPVLLRRGLSSSPSSPTEEQALRWRESFQRMLDLVGAMQRAGITVVAGTDDMPGLMLHRELELYVRAGLTPAQALQTATSNAARVAGVATSAGSIERGKDADLLLVDGDPTRDITTLRRARLVIQGDKAYAPADLYTAMGVKPFVPALGIRRHAPAP